MTAPATTWPTILAATPPDTPAWTWSEDQTVGFIRRRQAHEALIHRVDAELTAGRRTPMDPGLSADGVDEALRVMYGGVPPWGIFTPTGAGTLRLRAPDTGNTWLVTTGRFTGTDPDDAKLRPARLWSPTPTPGPGPRRGHGHGGRPRLLALAPPRIHARHHLRRPRGPRPIQSAIAPGIN